MAYYNPYSGYYPPQMAQPMQQPQPMAQPQPMQQPQQIQNNGFISVPSEDIVNSYPVAPGNCVTFKIEGKPIVMEKSMGFSQLEAPRVERYRLVKEEPKTPQIEPEQPKVDYLPINDFKAEIERIWSEIESIKNDLTKSDTSKKSNKRKEDGDD